MDQVGKALMMIDSQLAAVCAQYAVDKQLVVAWDKFSMDAEFHETHGGSHHSELL